MSGKVQKVQRVVVSLLRSDEHEDSVTGFTFVSPVLHAGELKPPSLGRGWRRQATEDRGVSSLLIFGVPQGSAQLLSEKGACVTGYPPHPSS